ncbi:mannose-1-phosphate guanylyltransferase [Alicyclobacillus cycloheptanicus]|uniref:Mannose-1-phosphate guanylyltransferase/mannose-6-phosphate isomerase n=1 Tax=Alicyclobacillus cycloheptanicus TaxID=1457 RepID=A0ABT9XF23_9BACL|nr:sugar phosphate nucleotidyltransferase [Alicyclobacillus cycloheptanicus]MDQ0188674.1 mannose-1-phosphate guanylyltransferase/mannose-6-phosphate isomerase [Alicyclobacillus cycloheptanicus]WDM00654.1 mannose-1-phosphate guanylyltransferase [Alicyclobacillus cycloheptanicus]
MNGAVILAGGSGERLFPYSSASLPKQFLPLVGNQSMLQETYTRLRKRFTADQIFIVTQASFQDTVLHQLPSVTGEQIILEPARRDTAGAIALALAKLKGAFDVLLFCPADHHIEAGTEWDGALATAMDYAQMHRRITLFGIVPNYPETGYGYVEYERTDGPVCPVVKFHEKPSREVALKMVRSGQYLWNCGIFAIPCDVGIEAFRTHLPEHYQVIQQDFRAMDWSQFEALPKVSIDYGLMEKIHDKLAVVPAYFPWNDLGSWTALERVLNQDESGNYTFGQVKSLDAQNSIVFAPKHEVYLYDVSDLLIVCHDNQVLVANKNKSSEMKSWLPKLTDKPEVFQKHP